MEVKCICRVILVLIGIDLVLDNDLEMQIDFTESSLHSLYQSEATDRQVVGAGF
ncbi:MAG: hypothetical protein AAFP00_08140 [Bacteroidota bacterium]